MLNGSRHANMYEGVAFLCGQRCLRVAFAVDPKRRAVLLVAGDKAGVGQKHFYRRRIAKSDERFDSYLADLQQKLKKEKKS
jgi:hypothetical protein